MAESRSQNTMNAAEVVDLLKQKSDALHLEGMKRYGIDNSKALGVSMPKVRQLAKEIKKDQALSLALWGTGIHECRILTSMIGDPKLVTPQQMDQWGLISTRGMCATRFAGICLIARNLLWIKRLNTAHPNKNI